MRHLPAIAYKFPFFTEVYVLRQRPSGKWHVTIDQVPFGDAFDTAEAALESLRHSFDVPLKLLDWEVEAARPNEHGST